MLRTLSGQLIRAYSAMPPIRNPGASLVEVVAKLDEFAPKILSEKWDNTGLLVEPFSARPVTKIILTNDLSEDVMEEAVSKGTQMIVAYHPPIFSGLKSITNKTWKERLVSRCLEERIAVYSPHTSWDSIKGGVNDWLAECLPEHKREFIMDGVLPDTGIGRLCRLVKPVQLSTIISSVKQHAKLDHVQLAVARGKTVSSEISSVALCAGSGSSVLKGILADLYLTGEMSHHEVLDAVHCGTSVILTNHSNSERGFLDKFAGKLGDMLENKVQIIVSEKDHDPLKTV